MINLFKDTSKILFCSCCAVSVKKKTRLGSRMSLQSKKEKKKKEKIHKTKLDREGSKGCKNYKD